MFLEGPYFSAEGAMGLPKASPGENTGCIPHIIFEMK